MALLSGGSVGTNNILSPTNMRNNPMGNRFSNKRNQPPTSALTDVVNNNRAGIPMSSSNNTTLPSRQNYK